MNVATVVITGVKIIGKGVFELSKIGVWGVLTQYTNQQFREGSNRFIGETERGVEYATKRLRIIKEDDSN